MIFKTKALKLNRALEDSVLIYKFKSMFAAAKLQLTADGILIKPQLYGGGCLCCKNSEPQTGSESSREPIDYILNRMELK